MHYSDNIPIYIQIVEDIKEQIMTGELEELEKLRSVRDYAAYYEVTTLTMQRAMATLEAEGITSVRKGIGSFIKEGIKKYLLNSYHQNMTRDYISKMRNIGFHDEEIIAAIKEGIGHESDVDHI